ncbi:hypothetical protein KQ944_16915 [Bacillus subtilis]|uniref:hypothetical protein n=1 Tax=Pseudochrobactrum asaccharolyticum TaxID=354351 RepID=UPI001F347EEE|nr:hypothetical protein [Pseudochrobactrum asaccharolyticum]MCF7647058.1 hypothetical protein [Pseudochrobactrum asaccharolyticum]MCF7673320.1 hypothetical protein [Bacillus subtilis]
MDYLLWIALAGVIVFLLGLLYSKFISPNTKQPATNTIPPAKSPAPVKAASEKPAQPKASPAPLSIKMVVPEIKQTDADKQPEQVVPVKTQEKIIPAAEPVGPAHSKPITTTAPQIVPIPAKSEKLHIENTTPLASEPETIVVPQPATEPDLLKKPRNGTADDLTLINGIGKAIQSKLFTIGIFHYDQLADLNELQIGWLNRSTGFAGRAERENWCAQAKKLMAKSATAPSTAPKRTVKKTTKPTTKAKPKTVKKTEAAQ